MPVYALLKAQSTSFFLHAQTPLELDGLVLHQLLPCPTVAFAECIWVRHRPQRLLAVTSAEYELLQWQ
jgi:hypothetical protein